jgi:hypothetical protein
MTMISKVTNDNDIEIMACFAINKTTMLNEL